MLVSGLALLVLAGAASAASIADTVRAHPLLRRGAAFVAANPQWATAQGTLFMAADAVFPAAGYGGFFSTALVPHKTTHYIIVKDAASELRVVFDNYSPRGTEDPEIHVRWGIDEGLVANKGYIECDNGWLYIMDKPIPPLSSLEATLGARNSSMFASAIAGAGLSQFVAGLQGYTLFAPTNGVFAAASMRFNALTVDQRRAVVLSHFVLRDIVSTALSQAVLPSLMTGASIDMRLGAGEGGLTLNGFASPPPADNFAVGGVFHPVDGVLFPAVIPTGSVPIPSMLPSPSSVSSTTAAATARSTATSSRSTATASPSASPKAASGASSLASSFFASLFGIAAMAAF